MASKGYQVEQDLVGSVPDIVDSLDLLNKVSQWSVQFSSGDQYATATALRKGAKPFILGLVPPDVEVNYVPIERDPARLADVMGSSAGTVGTATTSSTGGLPDSFYRKLGMVAKSIGCSPYDLMAVLYSESGLDAGAKNYVGGDKSKGENGVQARGLNQITPAACKVSGMSIDFWRGEYSSLSAEEQLPYVERFFKGVYSGSYSNAAQLYVANFAPGFTAAAGNPDTVLYRATKPDGSPNPNYVENQKLDKAGKKYITAGDMAAAVEGAKKSSGFKAHVERLEAVMGKDAAYAKGAVQPGYALGPGASPTGQGGAPATVLGGVMANGNVTAMEEDDPAGGRTGRNIRVSDARLAVVMKQVRELQLQIDAARAVPGLLMLVNPSEFQRSYEPSVDAPKTRSGHVVHSWLEKPASISCKGVTAAQFAIDASGTGGLSQSHRIHSVSYRNLLSLISLYRNNGQLFTGQSAEQSQSGVPTIQMSVFVYYDGHVYLGSFDDLQVTDSADKPFNMSYSWKFSVRYDFDVSSVTDDLIERALAMGGTVPSSLSIPADSLPSASSFYPSGGFTVVDKDGVSRPYPVPDGSPVPDGTGITSEGVASYYNKLPGVPKAGGDK